MWEELGFFLGLLLKRFLSNLINTGCSVVLFLLEEQMKLSLSWAFDHIQADYSAVDVEYLISALGKTTAEIDGVIRFSFDWKSFFVAEVVSLGDDIQLVIPEKNKKLSLEARSDLYVGALALVRHTKQGYEWAKFVDLGGSREGVLPEVFIPEEHREGSWREGLIEHDCILDIDNKSLTNRPDLWGHRGFAREIAAILGVELVPEEHVCPPLPICHFTAESNLAVIEDNRVCNRFAVFSIEDIDVQPSALPFFVRLVQIGAKPINAIVDLTNYVMFDLGHPMHAFDANKIVGEQLVVRSACDGEHLVLLDGSTITLSPQDCVVADQAHVLSLAGVMGGLDSGISNKTTSIILEAAHFDPTAVRVSAQKAKVRTESSMRFEKGLDPNANVAALERFLLLFKQQGLAGSAADSIISLGKVFEDSVILLSHRLLVDKLGCAVVESDVETILHRLGFGVQAEQSVDGVVYRVHVPLFRSFKDVRIPEDLVEEVARFVGYDRIPQVLPTRQMRPFDIEKTMMRRAIKAHCAYGCGMREVSRYSLYDETFLREAEITISRAQELKNPISENYRRLVTSLVPHLLQAIAGNAILRDELRFFEMARIWRFEDESVMPLEEEQIAGVFFARKAFDFYQAKQALISLFDLCRVFPEWRVAQEERVPQWFDVTRTAELWLDGNPLGFFGAVDPLLMQKIIAGRSCCFAFELRAELLLAGKGRQQSVYQPLSRYQATFFDVSIFAPYTVTVAQLQNAIASLDARIREVVLVDMFEKPEWENARSVTIRYLVQDDEETLTKDDLDGIQNSVVTLVSSLGGEVR